jgi:hypothetical protein
MLSYASFLVRDVILRLLWLALPLSHIGHKVFRQYNPLYAYNEHIHN